VLDDICPKPDIRQDSNTCVFKPSPTRNFQTEDKNQRADIAEVYLQINLEPQNYSLFKELLSRPDPRVTASPADQEPTRVRASMPTSTQTDNGRLVQTRSNSYFKLLDSGRITAWLRPLRQGQVYCGRRRLRVVGVIKPKSFSVVRLVILRIRPILRLPFQQGSESYTLFSSRQALSLQLFVFS